MENNKQIQGNAEGGNEQNSINLRDIVFLVLNNWYWFVISVVVCLGVAALVYKTQPKTFTASGTILVRDNGNKVNYTSRNMDQIMNSMGWDNSNLSLENEIYMLRSSSLMAQVVQRLNMHYYCNRKDMFRKVTYYKDAPVELTVHDLREDRLPQLDLRVTLKANNKYAYEIRGDRYKKTAKTLKGEAYYSQSINIDDTVSFMIEKTRFYKDDMEGMRLYVGVSEPLTMARGMINDLTVSRVDKFASILSISYKDPNQKRSGDIVDTLIAVYNDDAVEDKNKVAQKTNSFISDRIALISGELDIVDAQVEQIKRSSGMPELQGAANTLLQTGTRYNEEVNRLETELTLIRFIKNVLSDPTNKEDILPANVGIQDAGIQSMIASYNRLVTEYQRTKTTGGANNPQVRNLVSQMDAQWGAINSAVNNLLNATSVRLQDARNQEARARGQIAAMPGQTKAVTEVTRQQKIKEELYLYLLSKREETAMNLAVTISNAKVVEPSKSTLTAPKLMMFALVAIVLGLALPALIMFGISFFDTKLRSKSDIERMTNLPILGEIPQKPAARANDEIIVTANGTDVVTEAFRLLHSNLPFFMKDGQKVIQTVSTTPGEGKSYTALNLALSLAYVGKRTILVDFDLRKRSLSKTIDRHNRMGLMTTSTISSARRRRQTPPSC